MPKYSSRDMQRLAGSVPSIEQRMDKVKAAIADSWKSYIASYQTQRNVK
jgi:hypothetical protein